MNSISQFSQYFNPQLHVPPSSPELKSKSRINLHKYNPQVLMLHLPRLGPHAMAFRAMTNPQRLISTEKQQQIALNSPRDIKTSCVGSPGLSSDDDQFSPSAVTPTQAEGGQAQAQSP